MMMATRNDIKDRLIHNQSPYPTKDKVLSYTIPVDHSESLLFCSSTSQDNGSLNFITPDDDPCNNGRDSLASFLDEGLGTSLDGVDEIASPIFPTLGRNDSGIFSSDEGAGGIVQGGLTTTTTHNHASLISPPISSSTSTCSSISSSSLCGGSGSSSVSCSSNIIPVAEVVSWKGSSSSGRTSSSTTNHHPSNILLSPPTATISVVTDSATGIPSIICTSTVNSSSSGVVRVVKSEGGKASGVPATKSGKSGASQSQQGGQQRCKSMPLGRQGPQKCTICDKVFSNASALTKHKLTHSDERRHACATCGKAFKRQDHLNGHMLTHRNKKPFECKSKGCGKSYCDARSLRRHVENRHGHDVLESMNLTTHHNKHTKNNHSQNNINHEQPPQPELPAPPPPVATVTFCPVSKAVSCPGERSRQRENGSKKLLDCMPVLHPEQPQLQLQMESEKITISAQPPPPLPVLQKAGESVAPPPPPPVLQGASATQVPIVLKRENVSVFDFDESVEDAPVSFTQEKLLSSLNNSAIKVSNVIDSSKFAPLPDIRLIQEWTKRLGDSKVALFLASSSAASSIAQLAGPMTSIQLDGQQHAVALPGGGHAFIPTSENGLFSVTPISLVPTSSGEFTFKPAMISVPTSESPKPLYIVPSEPLLSTIPPPTIQVSAGGSLPPNSVPPPLALNCTSSSLISSVPKLDQSKPKVAKESKSKSEKDKGKGGIGASLANRIKTKLKAGSLKKLGKGNSKLSNEVPAPNGSELPKHCPSIVVTSNIKSNGEETGGGKVTMMPAPQLPPPPPPPSTSSMPTIAITAGVGVTSWCESPKDCLLTGMEEDRLSEGAEGEDKPVECSICCRRFKNTPALNGHMRLHGGYFKKDTEGSKKKDQVSKEPTNSTPLQTASVSVRALIEEKIKERRNNLLKLAAAAAAEKAANGGAPPLEQTSQSQSTPTNGSSPPKSKSDKHKSPTVVTTPGPTVAVCGMEGPSSTPPTTTLIAQPKLLLDGVKLKMEPNPEKDRNCDHETNNISTSASLTNNNPSTPVIDPSFQDLSILIGDGNVIGGRGNGVSDLLPSTIRMDTNQNLNSLPIIDKSNFTLLDCGINPEDLCQAFHLIYVDNNGADLTSAMNQATFGKVSKMFQDPVLEMSSFVGTMNDNQNIKVEPVLCQPHEDPCNLPWEWRNSTSSDNTDNSLSNVQDCVNSLLCSSSETTDESSKDPVAGGGYCYTPILSPSSTFCLTPGPDSPFETTSHSLSFICPSPTMGNTSSFHDAASTLINSPSMEPLFASEQPPQILPSTNLSMSSGQTHGINLEKYMPLHEQSIENHIFINAFDGLDQKPPIGLSNLPQMSQQQQINQIPNHQSGGTVESLPSINSFPTMITSSTCSSSASDLCKFGTNFGQTLISTSPKDIVLHCPVNNGVQQSFVPFEVFTPVPIPKKISEKWSCGRMEKSRKINVGPEYQAEIPNFRGSKGRTKSYRSTDEKLWDPSILDLVTLDEVDKYLEFACCSAVPGGGMNKEYALHLLTLSRGNIREALLRLMDKLPSLPPKLRNYSYVENQRWTSEEIMAFQISLVQAGKDFIRIAKGIGTKGHSECVSFYYFWKKVCPNEYEVMRQIWKDRLDHQSQSLMTANMSNNCNLSFLVPAQDFRSLCK